MDEEKGRVKGNGPASGSGNKQGSSGRKYVQREERKKMDKMNTEEKSK